MNISTEPDFQFDDSPDEEFPLQPESRLKKYLVRIVALGLAMAFFVLVSGGVIRLLGMPSLGFLIESRNLSQDAQIKAMIGAVVSVEAGNRRGTGFNIDPRGLVVTCNHIVEGAGSVSVSFASGVKQDVSEWEQAPPVDLAVIPLDLEGLPVLELAAGTLPAPDDALIVIGNPLGFFRVANRATFLGTAVLEGSSTEVLVISGPVYKGNSGSPVINSEGEVIGVIFATSTDTDSDEIIAFAIPVAEIIKQVAAIDP